MKKGGRPFLAVAGRISITVQKYLKITIFSQKKMILPCQKAVTNQTNYTETEMIRLRKELLLFLFKVHSQ